MADLKSRTEYVMRSQKTPADKLNSTWGTDMVKIFVGTERKKYVLHKMLVCREAPYFDNMFNRSFKEAKAQECFLQEEEPFAFELFVCYIYANRFPDDIKAVCGVRFVYEPMIKFYVLADKLMMSKAAKTASLDALVKARAAISIP